MIDSKPAPSGEVEMKLYLKGREIKSGDTVPTCHVGVDGKYEFSSYRAGDGAEPGEYVISVEWLKMSFGALLGPDRLLNNFNSPTNKDPRFHVTVVKGQSLKIPIIEIKTSDLKQQPSHPYASRAGKRH